MRVLVIGSGGREHALCWSLAASPLADALYCAPGNPGMAALGEVRPVAATDVAGQVALAREISADLVVIGPETAIEAGLADALARAGIACFGPTAAAGRLEAYAVSTEVNDVRNDGPQLLEPISFGHDAVKAPPDG